MSRTVEQLRRMCAEPMGPDGHELLAVEDILPLLDIVEAFAEEEPLTYHVPSGASLCVYCDSAEDTDWRVQHADNCPWLAARRLCGMDVEDE